MALPPVDDQVLDYYYDLFDGVFGRRFAKEIDDRVKRDDALERLRAAARAASRSLMRYFRRAGSDEATVARILDALRPLIERVALDHVVNPNRNAESEAKDLIEVLPGGAELEKADLGPSYRLILTGMIRDLMRLGPAIATWRKLGFPRRFEMLERIIGEFDGVSERFDSFGGAASAGADQNFELDYREYIVQRFFQVDLGTVRMTADGNVDLNLLFVMPNVSDEGRIATARKEEDGSPIELLSLAAARSLFRQKPSDGDDDAIPALKQVEDHDRIVFIGVPGSGKSTFLEWLNLQLADPVKFDFPQGGGQAIPVLLRVRQLDPSNLPMGAGLFAAATEGEDRIRDMPDGWAERMLGGGRVVLMLDGLDEVDPALRDGLVLPWLKRLYTDFPACRFIVSSRPAGYPPGALADAEFVACAINDFSTEQSEEYVTNWCTAVRLARNEPADIARAEGEREAKGIVEGFRAHPNVAHLARNPLMLSAICLVNKFEGGHLPDDRAKLYELCVEGLLHQWDHHRGIASEFTLTEKLHACREVAIAMQANDQAEMQATDVRSIFINSLENSERADRLFEYVRHRAGMLIERRPGMFAFAHLTFQEYLAACAIIEGNRESIEPATLIENNSDRRWAEVIPLYCGAAPARLGREIIEKLLELDIEKFSPAVLGESYLAANKNVDQNRELASIVIDRLCQGLSLNSFFLLNRFSVHEVAHIANRTLGMVTESALDTRLSSSILSEFIRISGAGFWLRIHLDELNCNEQIDKLRNYDDTYLNCANEIVYTLHKVLNKEVYKFFIGNKHIYHNYT